MWPVENPSDRPLWVSRVVPMSEDLGSDDSEFPLHEAIKAGDIASVKELIAARVDVNKARGFLDETPLIAAIRKGYIEIVCLLLSAEADVNKKSFMQYPLEIAVEKGDEPMVGLLLESGAWPNLKCFGYEPLHIAACNLSTKIVRMLLAKGALVNGLNGEYITPLYCAAKNGRLANIQILYAYGADLDQSKLGFSMTAAAYAKKHFHPEAADYIRLLPDFTRGLTLSLTAFAMILHPRCNNGNNRIILPDAIQQIISCLKPRNHLYSTDEVNLYAAVVRNHDMQISRKRKCLFSNV